MNRLNLAPVDISNFDPRSVQRKVIDTIASLDLDPRRCILVGSAALLLYGVSLPPNPLLPDDGPRPSDVDLAIDASTFYSLNNAGVTPSGVRLVAKPQVNKVQHIINAPPIVDHLLPTDLISRARFPLTGRQITNYDGKFQRFYTQNSVYVPGTASSSGAKVRIATPDYLAKTLRREARMGDPKYGMDLQELLNASARNKR